MSHSIQNKNVTVVQSNLANPSAIGLLGLAMVTLVASSQKLGITDGSSFIIPWAIFLGATAQLYASIVDMKLNNTFGATAFGGYAFFWYSVGMTWLIQNGVFGETMQQTADPKQLGVAYVGYLIFTLYMTVAAMGTTKVLFAIFVCIDFLFLGLSLSTFGIMYHQTHLMAAYAELAIALLSFYGSAGNVLNTQFNQTILPLGKPFAVFQAK